MHGGEGHLPGPEDRIDENAGCYPRAARTGSTAAGATLRMDPMAPVREQPDAGEVLRTLRRYKLRIAVVALVALAAALTFSFLQDPVYEATAEVVVRQPGASSPFAGLASPASDPARVLGTEIRVIKGPEVRIGAQARLGGTPPKVSAVAAPDADVIRITTRDGVAARAAAAANAYAESYLDLRQREALDAFAKLNRDLQAGISDLQRQIDTATGPERDALLQAQGGFRQKLAEAQVGGNLGTSGARIVQPAVEPTSPISPTPVRTGVLAGLSGLLLGVGVALLSGRLDQSVRSKEDLERATPGLFTLGMLPKVHAPKKGEPPRLLTLHDPRSPTAEAHRALLASLQFLNHEEPARVIQITSPSTGDGKTTIVANLGVAMALAGQRVAVVCCDLRRPNLHEFFGVGNGVGLSTVLSGQAPLSSALQSVEQLPGLVVLPSGPPPPNPTELLGSKRTGQVLKSLLTVVDVVIIDCPPVLPVADALVLASQVNSSLLVCRAGKTSRKRLTRARELMLQVEAPLVGTILNGVPLEDSDTGAYYDEDERRGGTSTAVPG